MAYFQHFEENMTYENDQNISLQIPPLQTTPSFSMFENWYILSQKSYNHTHVFLKKSDNFFCVDFLPFDFGFGGFGFNLGALGFGFCFFWAGKSPRFASSVFRFICGLWRSPKAAFIWLWSLILFLTFSSFKSSRRRSSSNRSSFALVSAFVLASSKAFIIELSASFFFDFNTIRLPKRGFLGEDMNLSYTPLWFLTVRFDIFSRYLLAKVEFQT